MRRLELEAKMSNDAQDAKKGGMLVGGADKVSKNAAEELQLREELKHARETAMNQANERKEKLDAAVAAA